MRSIRPACIPRSTGAGLGHIHQEVFGNLFSTLSQWQNAIMVTIVSDKTDLNSEL